MTAVTVGPQLAGGTTLHAGVDPDDRGRLRIDPSVLRKVAEHTADHTPGTVAAPRTVAGVGLGATGATARVTVTTQRVDLRVELALRYPGPVRTIVDQLRARITDELQRITGYQVRSIAVTVTALLPEPSSRVH
ncbi:MAG TPA: Asp23/Gls24 family envelope stress response protein [Pseudonocardiaceae bacterium]